MNVVFGRKFAHFLLVGISVFVLFYAAQSAAFSGIQNVAAVQGCGNPPPAYPQCGTGSGTCINSGPIDSDHTVIVTPEFDSNCNLVYRCEDQQKIPGQCGNPPACTETPNQYPQCGAAAGACSNHPASIDPNRTVLVDKKVDGSCNVTYDCQDLGVKPGECGNTQCTEVRQYNECTGCNTSRRVSQDSCGNYKVVVESQADAACTAGCSTPPPPPPPSAPPCDGGQVSMSVSPNPANTGNSMTFNVSGSQGSTWIGDSWSGGVNCSGSFWGSKTCTAVTAGSNFSWTHTWQNTAPNNTEIKSPQCSKTVNFSIQGETPPPPPACVPNPNLCSASAPACGATTRGTDNCGNPCTKTGPACPPPSAPPSAPPSVPPTAPPSGAVNCPTGTNREIRDGIIVCVQTIVTNNITNNNTNSNSATGGSASNVNNITFGNVGVGVAQPQVAGTVVTALPKTGLPLLAWSALAFIPAGFGMKRFRKIKKESDADPNFLWEEKQFKTEA